MPELYPYEKLITYIKQKKIHAESVKGIFWEDVLEDVKDSEHMYKDFKEIKDSFLRKEITIKDCEYKGRDSKTLYFKISFSNDRSAVFKSNEICFSFEDTHSTNGV